MSPTRPGKGTFPRYRYLAAVSAEAVGGGMYVPVSLLYFHRVAGLPLGQVGGALTVAALVGLAVSPFFGALVDRLGARSVVAVGFAVRAVGFVCYPFVHQWWQLLAAATLVAVGDRSFQASIQALISELAQGAERQRMIATQSSLRNAGFGVGGLLASLALAADADWAYHAVVLGSGAGLALAAVLIAGLPSGRVPAAAAAEATADGRAADGPRPSGGYGAVLRDRPYLGLTLATVPLAFCYSSLSVILPVYTTQTLHASASLPGLLFTVNTVLVALAQVPVNSWTSKWRRTRVAAMGGVVFAAAFLGFAALSALDGGVVLVSGLMLTTVLYTGGELLHSPSSGALSTDAAPDALRGRYLAVYYLSWSVAKAAAPALFTTLLAVSAQLTWLLLAGGVLIGSLAMLRLEPRLPAHAVRPAPAPAPEPEPGNAEPESAEAVAAAATPTRRTRRS
ncbi:MFS transporter [Streptomyces hesseae]|uniref:MFS transporter n=1 Tax=Streptomyces hesseae TaxID=3075519 RepID=A0ABU2STB6_9ACTN|nr:MFS transporter [Streptomyces sp. DSM 40473]MDT0452248.1 MFS transporter [Streptomyces sp. DSM 40473]